MKEISPIGVAGEMVFAANDLFDGVKNYYYKRELPEISSIFSKSAAALTFAGYYFVKYGEKLGVAGAILSAFTLEKDNDDLAKAIRLNDKDNIILSGLSVISDVASIVAAIPIPQVKIFAISIVGIASACKELYANRKEIAKCLSDLSSKLAHFAKKLKYDSSIYLNLPNSAIRCHVVNGCNMNRGLVYQGAYSQNRLQPHLRGTEGIQHRTPTQRTLTADEMRIQQRLDRVVSYLQEHPYTSRVFEWKKPGVFELSTYPKR